MRPPSRPARRALLRAAAVVVVALAAGCRNECPEGMESRSGRCVSPCNSDVDCKRSEACREGVCAAVAGSSSSSGGQAASSGAVESSRGTPSAVASSWGAATSALASSSFSAATSSATVTTSSSAAPPSSSSAAVSSSSSAAGTSSSSAGASSSSGPVDAGVPGPRDQACPAGTCTSGLTCDYSQLSGGTLVTATRVCHQTCAWGGAAGQCGVAEVCLPSLSTLHGAQYSVQLADGGGAVTCSADGGNTCNAAAGFGCHVLSTGAVCSRLAGACGTPVPPFDLSPAGPRDAGEYCNTGSPSLAPGTDLWVGGSRFCDPYAGLSRPPWVFCDQWTNSTVGTCYAACALPEPDGGVSQRDCPAGYACAPGVANLFRALEPYQPCAVAAQCSVTGTECAGPFPVADGGNLCARRYGVCQPVP